MLKGMQNGIQNIYLLQFLEFYHKPQNYTVSSKTVGRYCEKKPVLYIYV